jgi:uncharacterized CHY-type Zn-finger protein
MEETKFDKVYNDIRILIKEQKVHSTKIAELEKNLDLNKKYISKLEEALNKEKDETGKESESEKQQLEELVKKIDIKLEEVEKVIEESVAKIKTMENEQRTTDTDKFKCFECHQQFDTKKILKLHIKSNHIKSVKCNVCNELFDESWKLERHLTSHKEVKKYSCATCKKDFYAEWRLKKHMTIHESSNNKKCHYFNNEKECPYFEVGCMFVHEFSGQCKFGPACVRQLCPFQHGVKTCKVCDLELTTEKGQKQLQCGECDKFVCPTCAKETHISGEFFMCSICL